MTDADCTCHIHDDEVCDACAAAEEEDYSKSEVRAEARSQGIDDCIKVVMEAVEKDGVEEWRGTAIAEFITSRLEALKASGEKK